jgi:hypothetical protein
MSLCENRSEKIQLPESRTIPSQTCHPRQALRTRDFQDFEVSILLFDRLLKVILIVVPLRLSKVSRFTS